MRAFPREGAALSQCLIVKNSLNPLSQLIDAKQKKWSRVGTMKKGARKRPDLSFSERGFQPFFQPVDAIVSGLNIRLGQQHVKQRHRRLDAVDDQLP